MMDCSGPASNENSKNKDFYYRIEFSPSFLPPCKMEISQSDQFGQFKITVFDFADTLLTVAMVDSVKLSKADFDNFIKALGDIDLLKMKTSENQGLDGIGVKNFVTEKAKKNEFYFWSPDKGTGEHKIVEALMGLSRKSFKELKYTEYFESLEQYFSFGLPCKITNKDPLEVRIYGALSSNEEKELNEFINSLPSDRPILIDMTNFESMGTMFYPLFRSLIKRNKNLVWVTRHNEQLGEIGVDKNTIVNDINVGRQMIR